MLEHNHDIEHLGRKPRNKTIPCERRLWLTFLRNYRPRFTREKIFGNYTVDFYCAKAKLVIELDDGDDFTEEQQQQDVRRTQYLESLGLKVMRFTNPEEDKRFYEVCTMIDEYVQSHYIVTKSHHKRRSPFTEGADYVEVLFFPSVRG